MIKTHVATAAVLFGAACLVSSLVNAQSFDKLTDADRQAFAGRFTKELWPLLLRNGKDGCVGCHGPRHQSSLHFTGAPDKDFRLLLRDGFFLLGDSGSLNAHVSSKDERQRMPPGPRPRWTPAEMKLLADFTADVHKKQAK